MTGLVGVEASFVAVQRDIRQECINRCRCLMQALLLQMVA
jgi:hypothetical protein